LTPRRAISRYNVTGVTPARRDASRTLPAQASSSSAR